MILQRDTWLEELEDRFSKLEPRLADSPEKEAISILHAMVGLGAGRLALTQY